LPNGSLPQMFASTILQSFSSCGNSTLIGFLMQALIQSG
jgi:hypothetical protein